MAWRRRKGFVAGSGAFSGERPASEAIGHAGTERVIAAARIAGSALVAASVWLDPQASDAGLHAALGYLFFALIVALLPARILASGFLRFSFHIADLAAVGFLVQRTDATLNVYWVPFILLLLAGSLRWNWRGTIATGLVLPVVLVAGAYWNVANLPESVAGTLPGSAAYANLPEVPDAPSVTGSLSNPDDQRPWASSEQMLQFGFILVAALMLAYFGAVRERASRAAVALSAQLGRAERQNELAKDDVRRERSRLARDVHDGVLQDLAAANLILRSAAPSLPEGARGRVAEVTALLAEQQRRLRTMVESINPKPNPPANLLATLAPLASGLSETWNACVRTDVRPLDLTVTADIASAIGFMLGEVVANAVSHGGATEIDATLGARGATLQIEFRDNGSAAMPDASGGAFVPVSLSERAADLGGSLSAACTDAGAVVRVELPLR